MHRVIDRILLKQKIESQGNKIFSVDFYKKDGTPRRMNCRLHVKTPLKGGLNNVEPNNPHLKVVYDLKSKGYRTINLNTIYACSLNGKAYEVQQPEK
jgi:hypothetical protein